MATIWLFNFPGISEMRAIKTRPKAPFPISRPISRIDECEISNQSSSFVKINNFRWNNNPLNCFIIHSPSLFRSTRCSLALESFELLWNKRSKKTIMRSTTVSSKNLRHVVNKSSLDVLTFDIYLKSSNDKIRIEGNEVNLFNEIFREM